MAEETAITPQTAPPTGDVNLNSKQALVNTFQSSPLESKKWLAMMICIGCMMMLEVAGMSLIAVSEVGKANAYVTLINIGVMFIGGVTGSLITGQSFVEWKTSSTLGDMHNTEVKAAVETQNVNIKKDVHIDVPYTKDMDEKIKESDAEGTPEVKPFGAAAQ